MNDKRPGFDDVRMLTAISCDLSTSSCFLRLAASKFYTDLSNVYVGLNFNLYIYKCIYIFQIFLKPTAMG